MSMSRKTSPSLLVTRRAVDGYDQGRNRGIAVRFHQLTGKATK